MWESNPRYTSAQLYDAGETNLTREKQKKTGKAGDLEIPFSITVE